MYNGLELRVPFYDYRLTQYVWNITWEIKALKGREKGLLSKTHNPTYLTKVKCMLEDIIKDKNAPINNFLNRDYILDFLNTNGSPFTSP